MTDEKMLQIVTELEAMLPPEEVLKRRTSRGASFQSAFDRKCLHIHTMLPRLRALIAEGKREKAMRWIGFIQGALWAGDGRSLDAFKAMNRSDDGDV